MIQPSHVQIEFEFVCTIADYRELTEHAARAIAGVAGLVSKLWLIDEERRRAGGAYLFADRTSAQAYIDGPIIAGLRRNPAIRDVSVKLFDVLAAPSELTRGVQARAS